MDKGKEEAINRIDFSIIIPTYNSEAFLSNAIESIRRQTYKNFEIIVVDDGSKDATCAIAKLMPDVRLVEGNMNRGPGAARNAGMRYAQGKYLIFLDSDDELEKDILLNIKMLKGEEDFELLAFDFMWNNKEFERQRTDWRYLSLCKEELLEHYLKLHMDGSVIFTCFNKAFLEEKNIAFREGIHEDIDFMYKVYSSARKIVLLDKIGYIKFNREDSIVNTFSKSHIEGYFNAWYAIGKIIGTDAERRKWWEQGLVSVGAILIRKIVRIRDNVLEKSEWYARILNEISKGIKLEDLEQHFQTKYYKLVNKLLVSAEKLHDEQGLMTVEEELKDILNKTWSCWDIEHSLFLGRTQIRACCKRFFIENMRKGDVVLVDINEKMNVYEQYKQARKRIKIDLNQGEKKECQGCPYLEYKDWGEEQGLKKISFEYHSICNLRCSYCSEEYYGGKKPAYDVSSFVTKIVGERIIETCESIVWGGGEPTLDKNFPAMVKQLTEACPKIKQNIITNSICYSETIADLLKKNRVNVITSVDAGTADTYKAIRGGDFYNHVFENLFQYAQCNAQNIIIKYIIIGKNSSYTELKAFVVKTKELNLEKCNFQISCNFEKASLSFEEKLGAVVLYCMLKKIGTKIVYFDELLRERINVNPDELEKIKVYLAGKGLSGFILEKKRNDIVLWGSDNQIRLIVEKTSYFKESSPAGLIAGHSDYIKSKYNGMEYQSPDFFWGMDVQFVIAAVQGTRRIYDEFVEKGFDKEKLIDKLIL